MVDDNNSLLSRAEQLLHGRRNAITGLEDANVELETARSNLAAAEKKMREAVSAAMDAGWTTGELRQLDISVPEPRRGKSAATRKRRPASSSDTVPGAAPDPV